jgi:hypothetical protein
MTLLKLHQLLSDPVNGFLGLDRPWLSERLVAWPILASRELLRESALSVRVFGLPVLLVRGAMGGCQPTSMPAPTGSCHFPVRARRRR